MNNEIKEILDYLAFLEDIDTQKKVKKVEDYITNLQHTEDLYNQLLKDYDELQQEHEKWWAIIKDYERDLHDLWNKNNEFEEKHSNEFQCWKRDRKELLDKRPE